MCIQYTYIYDTFFRLPVADKQKNILSRFTNNYLPYHNTIFYEYKIIILMITYKVEHIFYDKSTKKNYVGNKIIYMLFKFDVFKILKLTNL